MSISAEVVRQLREETGAGMMDCKSALVEAEGNLEEARKKAELADVADGRRTRTGWHRPDHKRRCYATSRRAAMDRPTLNSQ